MKEHPRVLIVDDVLDNVTVLADTLANSCLVQFASSGQECLALVRQSAPDLILLDVMMPDMSGYEVFSLLRTDEALSTIPVIFVTAKNDVQSEAEAIHAGAVDFIHKPIDPEVVRARVKMHLELIQHRRELEHRVMLRTQELATARMEAETAQAVVTRFMRNVSHEMRTPLHGILGFADILRGKLAPLGDAKLDACTESLRKATERLEKLVESMLDIASQSYAELTRIADDAIERVDLEKLVEACVLTHEKSMARRRQTVEVHAAADLPSVLGDPVRLRQLFEALIGNALRYSPEASTVRIGLDRPRQLAGHVSIQVMDEGCGIPEREIQAIFEPFYESTRTATGAGNTGLGLSLCKAIVKRHRGNLTAANRPEGGALFEVQLPIGD